MKIASIVRAGAVTLVGLILVGGVLASSRINMIRMGGPIQTENQLVSDLVADILPPPEYVIEAYLEATLLKDDPASIAERGARLSALHADYDRRHDYWVKSMLERGVRDKLTVEAHKPAQQFWEVLEESLIPAARSGDEPAMQQSYARLTEAYQDHRARIDETVTAANVYSKDLTSKSADALQHASLLIACLGGGALLLIGLFIWFVLRHIVRPLSRSAGTMTALTQGRLDVAITGKERRDEIGDLACAMEQFRHAEIEKHQLLEAERLSQEAQVTVIGALSEGLKNLAAGNLTYRIDGELSGDYEVLRKDFNSALTAMASALNVVSHSSATIQQGSTEVAQASQDLASRTQIQVQQVQRTTEALAEISQAITDTARRTSSMREAVDIAHGEADNGGKIVGQAIDAMSEIQSSATKIAEIVQLIDGIAFQTNLLALNAGVEAARAGAAGSGFAVVAHEVRALAQRAATAASEIRALIATSNAQVDKGAELVLETGSRLRSIVSEVTRISSLVHEIAGAVDGESQRIGEVSDVMATMDEVTQQNAAMVEESSASAEVLAQEAIRMAKLVSNFTIEMPDPSLADSVVDAARHSRSHRLMAA